MTFFWNLSLAFSSKSVNISHDFCNKNILYSEQKHSTCLYAHQKLKWEYNNIPIFIIRSWQWSELNLSICSIGKNQIRLLKSHLELWYYFICPTWIWLVFKSFLVLIRSYTIIKLSFRTMILFICSTRIWLVCKSLLVLIKIQNILHHMSVIKINLNFCWVHITIFVAPGANFNCVFFLDFTSFL